MCWAVSQVRGLGPVVAAHIHQGGRGVNGPPVVMLSRNPAGAWQGCTDAGSALAGAIGGNPAGFYVNLHTAAYPNGAIRGQLGG